MVELQNEEFFFVRDLVHRAHKVRPEAVAVVDGNNPGWVFVDEKDNPKTALIWPQGMEGFHLTGDCENSLFLSELNAFIDGFLMQRIRDNGLHDFEVSGDPGWDRTIEEIFSGRALHIGKQYVYTLRKPNFAFHQVSHIPQGYYLESVRSVIKNTNQYENIDFMKNIIASFWGSEENFLSKGAGYCITTDNRIVSTAYTSFIAGSTHAIGIETLKEYQRRGFAEIVAQELIKEHIRLKGHSHWDCMEENTASFKLAEKLGFVKEYEYNVYWFNIAPSAED